jgi:hypothetical protein
LLTQQEFRSQNLQLDQRIQCREQVRAPGVVAYPLEHVGTVEVPRQPADEIAQHGVEVLGGAIVGGPWCQGTSRCLGIITDFPYEKPDFIDEPV